ncbi:MAG: sigma-70 family RNA polymerase sigma factor [Bacteroidales bacterium]|jgi:RNA polymerase sigma factor (sigma-70 family)|nr:sigma-70 family RNA polymerase sigma factor [Bacteroidales bacterium]
MGEEETKFSSFEILEGIKTHDRIILKYVYDTYFPQVYKYIENRKGCESDAWDVFQDVMGVIYDYSQKPDFKLSVPFPQFFFSLTRNVWFGLLRKWKIGVDLVYDELQYLPDDDSEKLQEAIYNQVINRLTHKYLSQLDERCMLLIKFSALGIATASIAKKLNYHSNRAVFNQRRKCIRKLIERIENDPDYKNLSDYERP